MTKFRVIMITLAVLLATSVSVVAGCTGGPPKGPVPPGVESGVLAGMEVVGYLTLANDAWTVLDADQTAANGAEPKALATLVPGSVDEGGIAALDGRYIWAAGPSSDSQSDVPKIKVDGIDVAVEPQ